MNLPENWPLVDPCDDGIRPAGPPDECFYCHQKVGRPHRRSCGIVTKLVRFRCTIDVDIDVPHSWSIEKIKEHVLARVSDAIFVNPNTETMDSLEYEYMKVIDEIPRRALHNQN